jgi:hypothetical protein
MTRTVLAIAAGYPVKTMYGDPVALVSLVSLTVTLQLCPWRIL